MPVFKNPSTRRRSTSHALGFLVNRVVIIMAALVSATCSQRALAQPIDPKTIEQLALLTLTNATRDDVIRVMGTAFTEHKTGKTRTMHYGSLPLPRSWRPTDPPPPALWVSLTNGTLKAFGVGGEPVLSSGTLDRIRSVISKTMSLQELLALLGPPSAWLGERRIYHFDIAAPDALRRTTGLAKVRLRWRSVGPTNGLYYLGMIPSTDIANSQREFWNAVGHSPTNQLHAQERGDEIKQVLAQLISVDQAPPKNAKEQTRLENLLSRVLRSAPPNFGPVTIRVLESSEPNAFSVPLTNRFCIGLTRKLMELVSSDEELAAFIAHEIGHGIEETPSREILSRWTTLDRDRLTTLQVYSWTWRSRELSSDCVGIELLIAAGYQPGALQRALRHIPQQISLTHPATEQRDGFLNWYCEYRTSASKTSR